MLKITNDVKEFTSEEECVVYFSAEWCMPCKQLKPQYGKVAVVDPEMNYYLVDVDKIDSQTLDKYNIKSIPKIFAMNNGEITKEIASKTSDEILKELGRK